MNNHKPAISIFVFTYNRAHLVPRAVESVLNQTYRDFDFILIDNGSTDNTWEVLQPYGEDERVRLFRLPENRGVNGGFNFGLEQIIGEWYCHLGDDDELLPEAFETMLRVPQEVDPTIDAVTCNCLDSASGEFTGTGLDGDQYLTAEKIIRKTDGDFWGITKTSLLGDKRYNEKLRGFENTFYYKIDAIANRYYIHKGLRVYNTTFEGRESTINHNKTPEHWAVVYKTLLEEPFYFQVVEKYHPKKFIRKCLAGIYYLEKANDKLSASKYREMLRESKHNSLAVTALSHGVKYVNPSLLRKVKLGKNS